MEEALYRVVVDYGTEYANDCGEMTETQLLAYLSKPIIGAHPARSARRVGPEGWSAGGIRKRCGQNLVREDQPGHSSFGLKLSVRGSAQVWNFLGIVSGLLTLSCERTPPIGNRRKPS